MDCVYSSCASSCMHFRTWDTLRLICRSQAGGGDKEAQTREMRRTHDFYTLVVELYQVIVNAGNSPKTENQKYVAQSAKQTTKKNVWKNSTATSLSRNYDLVTQKIHRLCCNAARGKNMFFWWWQISRSESRKHFLQGMIRANRSSYSELLDIRWLYCVLSFVLIWDPWRYIEKTVYNKLQHFIIHLS